MDPNANITRQRELAAEIKAIEGRQNPTSHDLRDEDWPAIAECAIELAELVQALDEWRRKGGFDPYV